ncbi:MAG: DNA alkylation repair protein [bacterium]
MTYEEIIKKLKSLGNPKNVTGMARFGLSSKTTVVLGIKKPVMDKMAKAIGKDTELALKLWDSKIYEARVLAALIADPNVLTEKQIDKWISDFDNWGVCDNACMNLFHKIPNAHKKAKKLAVSPREFVRRTGFALIASLTVHDKKATDSSFVKFLPIIKKHSTDERNYVKKAVNWALRQIGKRNKNLNKEAIKTAREILSASRRIDSKAAKWIAGDAIRELTSAAVQKRLR